MKTIIVASQNPVKIESVRSGFGRIFPDETFQVTGVTVPSGVSDQPMTSIETLQGALNRSQGAAQSTPQADYWVGIEGGAEDTPEGMGVFAWIVIRSDGVVGKSRTGTFFLPESVAILVRQGIELGEADDIIFQRSNSKQGNGAIGILTGDVIDRLGLYEHAVILALLPFCNRELYQA